MFAAFQVGSAFGPPVMGAYYDAVGHYVGALWVLVVIVGIGTLLITLLGPYPDEVCP
jgi:MFS family permease